MLLLRLIQYRFVTSKSSMPSHAIQASNTLLS